MLQFHPEPRAEIHTRLPRFLSRQYRNIEVVAKNGGQDYNARTFRGLLSPLMITAHTIGSPLKILEEF
jgi:hypothetical protein